MDEDILSPGTLQYAAWQMDRRVSDLWPLSGVTDSHSPWKQSVQSLKPLRQRTGDPSLAFSSQRLVEGRGIPQEGRDPFTVSRPPSGRSRQNRSHSIGHLEFSPLPPPLLSPSLSHPSLDPHPLSVSPLPSISSSSSCSETTTHLSALFFRSSSCFHSVEAATLQATGGAVVSQRRRCRSRSFGDIMNRSDSDSALPLAHSESQGLSNSKPYLLSTKLHLLQGQGSSLSKGGGGLEKSSSLGELRGSSPGTFSSSCSTRSLCIAPDVVERPLAFSSSASSSSSGSVRGPGVQPTSRRSPTEEDGEESESSSSRKRNAFNKIFKKKQGRH
ncbi:hypothetical protein OJAV_G00135320 [Oryzias javanicus]|uniref:Uncharacterized protein n=1 Tax=Oryzias javanicus TaxID=123683 RepID=A0A3S2MAN0_ORYJA|nr:hypothetical protein OJAV_G00135320 [Oryzias javanicus]